MEKYNGVQEHLIQEREAAVAKLAEAAIRLRNANFEYQETIIEILAINKTIEGNKNGKEA